MQILYNGYINSSGYSVSAQDYILSARKTNPEIEIKLSYINSLVNTGISLNRRQLFLSMSKLPDRTPQVSVFHSIPTIYRRKPSANKHVGIALFETLNPPKAWINIMNKMDLIITASDFNKEVFTSNGLKSPICVVPHAFDDKLFNDNVLPHGRYRQFTFMSIGTFKARKNWETLIKAFYDGFEQKDNVCLLIKTDKPKELRNEVLNIKKNGSWKTKDTCPIYLDEKINCDFEDIPSLMKKADVYISASLGEGFGLPGLHAMALGIPVITTKFGGVLQYAKSDNCTFIEPRSYKSYPVMDRIPQFTNCTWPVITVEDVRNAMLEVFKNNPKHKTLEAYKYVHNTFNYNIIGKQFCETVIHA